MSECIFYQYKEGDYHCSLTNHDISDVNHVRKYCCGSCEDCPVYRSGQKADHHRGTDECIYYCMKNGDYYCQKASQYIGSDMVDSCCRNYNYGRCHVYNDSETAYDTFEDSSRAKKADTTSTNSDANRSASASSHGEKPGATSAQSNTYGTASGSSTNTNDFSVVSVIFCILGAVFIAVWKLIKTIPFWGPYGSILLFIFTAHAGPAGSSSGRGGAGVVGLFFLVYLILHTLLLFKCKKWQAKHRYWPIYTEFFIFVIGALLGGASFLVISSIPTVAFQIGVLIYMKRKPQNNSALLFQSCERQIGINAKHCPSYCKPVQNAQDNENVTVPMSEPSNEEKARKKIPLFVILPIAIILLLSIFHAIQYSGYKPFVKEYFNAVETGDMDEITQFYSWDYVEEKNEKNKSDRFTQFFVWDSLEYYIESNDKYSRWFMGEEIEKIEITRTTKNMLSSTPQIKVKLYVVFENRADDVVVFIDMERGSDGWYMTGTDAYYASDEAED